MHAAIVSIFPDMIRAMLAEGVVGRAVSRGDFLVEIYNPRDFTDDAHNTVDDRPFGGGPGMVMMAEPLTKCVERARAASPEVDLLTVYLSPQGRVLDHALALDLSRREGLVLVAGRYEGVDERFVSRQVDMELSIGDFVLSGGELAAMVVLDAVARLLPGTLGNPESASSESHVDGLLDFPHYTRPQSFGDQWVPEVLLSGDHRRIERWRRQQALGRTYLRRPDMLLEREMSADDRALLSEFIAQAGTR